MDLKKLLNHSILYVVRIMDNNKPGLAKPCQNCAQLLKEYGIKKVKYTDLDKNGNIILCTMKIN